MKPHCNCSHRFGDCPTPYACGFYQIEGHQESLDLDEQINGDRYLIIALIAIAALLVVALYYAIF